MIVDGDLGIELSQGFLGHLLFVEAGDLTVQLQAGLGALEADGVLAEMGLPAEGLFGLSQVNFGFWRKNRAHGSGFRKGNRGVTRECDIKLRQSEAKTEVFFPEFCLLLRIYRHIFSAD